MIEPDRVYEKSLNNVIRSIEEDSKDLTKILSEAAYDFKAIPVKDNGTKVLTLPAKTISIDAGESIEVETSMPWKDPAGRPSPGPTPDRRLRLRGAPHGPPPRPRIRANAHLTQTTKRTKFLPTLLESMS